MGDQQHSYCDGHDKGAEANEYIEAFGHDGVSAWDFFDAEDFEKDVCEEEKYGPLVAKLATAREFYPKLNRCGRRHLHTNTVTPKQWLDRIARWMRME